ncbi:MAG: tetratricopeptide repeat protein [Planctomycetes bacterium]|nr:tetratricopeptide repeat protein [Planctomycetota bacterium]MCD7897692.1 tetratricopeptide repeat protein [Planctomycetaceae bacterium]
MRSIIRVTALAVVIACLPTLARAGEDDAQRVRNFIDEGVSLLRTGSQDELHRAIARFKSALKIQPENAEAYFWIALAHSDLNNYLRAADNAKEATTYDDRLAEAWLLWGQVLLYQREWREALIKLETAAMLRPDDPVIQYNIGRVQYHGFKNPDAALPRFRAAWQRGQESRRDNPELIAMTIRSRLYMGCCEYDRGVKQNNFNNLTAAINAFQDVIQEQPHNYDARLRLALALRKVNRVSESFAVLNDLLGVFQQAGDAADPRMLAEIHLQIADLYLKYPAQFQERMRTILHLREFVRLTGDLSHPALEPAREYLAMYNGND